MQKFLIFSLTSVCFGAPQEGFGDATQEEIAQIRAGTFGEMFDDNPQYNFNFKVADDDKQTYIAQEESRDGESVTGSYSYVDPLGSLITVNYIAGPMGYQETRDVQEGFVTIRQTSQSTGASSGFSSGGSIGTSSQSTFGTSSGSSTGSSFGSSLTGFSTGSSFTSRPQSSGFTVVRPGSGSSSSSSQQSSSSQSNLQSDIVSQVVSQVQPLVSQTVSSAVSGAARPTATLAPRPSTSSSSSSTSSQSDIVAQIVSQISPLVSQTVNSAVSGASDTRFASQPAPTRRVSNLQPVEVAAPGSPSQPDLASGGTVTNLFGDGNFNVRFNTPDFNIEY